MNKSIDKENNDVKISRGYWFPYWREKYLKVLLNEMEYLSSQEFGLRINKVKTKVMKVMCLIL